MVPYNGTIGVNYKDVGVSISGPGVVHAVFLYDFGWLVIQHRELQADLLHGEACLREVVNANGQNLCIKFGELAVLILQLPELPPAESSPESTVEDEDHVLLASIGLEADFLTLSAG